MAKSYRGQPILTLRLPSWQISGLKMLANRDQTSVSALIRAQVDELLEQNGISEGSPSEIPGQIRVSDLSE